MIIMQIVIGNEMFDLMNEMREIMNSSNEVFDIQEGAYITNGFILNSAIRFLEDKIDYNDINYWEKVNKENIIYKFPKKEFSKNLTIKYRLSALSEERINQIVKNLSDGFGVRVRKNFVTKLILKSTIIELNKKEL
ncbi:hypothetical protein [Brochothrix thermosphacta]|uniref:hypothetical protein n=1 Tax=Brochothrix thermosphacta TaxID=2756 RepID=UPI000D799FEC|nr:hypothetical protein [Brochothrix thermosphacta]SPN75302.1 hypothetical protein BTEBP_20101 [Brochothrix thermosphacta]